MKRYEKYKDSGIQWIGKIPEHWKVMKIKLIADIIMGQSPAGEDIKSEGNTLFMQGNADFNEKYPTPSLYCDTCCKHSRVNDILMSVRAPVGALNISDKIYGIGRGLCSIKAINVSHQYLWFYLLKSSKDFGYYSTGSTFDAISVSTLNNFYCVIPPFSEQTAIASYLDRKVADIDSMISKAERKIELLEELKKSVITEAVTKGLDKNAKMKDSGVQWIGKVPEGWKVMRLKNITNVFGRIGFRGYSQNDLVSEGKGAITLSPSNMKNGTMDYTKCTYLAWNKYYESPEIMIQNGDILFVKTGSTYGKVSFVENLPLESTINPQIIVFKNILCNNRFLYYLLANRVIQDQVSLTVGGSTIPTLSQENILNYSFALPSIEKQSDISIYLDKECQAIDSQMSKARKRIELLKELKQTLITDVVTGKIKVTE